MHYFVIPRDTAVQTALLSAMAEFLPEQKLFFYLFY